MAKFSFTISGSAIDVLKSETPGTNSDFEVVADRGLNRETQQRVLIATFGDGYEQRALNGINPKAETFNITLANRDAADINLVAAYLDERAGKNFTFTVTDLAGDTNLKVTCDNYNTVYLREQYHSLQAQLRRVYEP